MFWQKQHMLENIFLLRHGNSMANEDNTLNARVADNAVELAAHGFGQAMQAGAGFQEFLASQKIKIKPKSMRLWYSPYVRTIQTRDNFLKGLGEDGARVIRDMRPDIRLVEQQFGLFDGLSDAEQAEKYPDEYARFQLYKEFGGRFYAKNPSGESRFDVCNRVQSFKGTIIRDAEKKTDNVPNALVVSHGSLIRAFVMEWLHLTPEWFEREPNPNNASIRHIGRDEEGRWKDFGYIFSGYPDQEAMRKMGEHTR